MNDPDTDNRLIERIRRGDEAAFEALVMRHRAAVVAHAMRILRDPDDAETAAQEVSLRVYRGLANFNSEARFTTWLYRITENVCRTMVGKRKRELDKIAALTREPAPEPDEAAVDAAEGDQLERLLAPLAEDEKQLLVLRFVHDREIRDIAIIMGNGLSATKMRLYRALDKVRARFDELPEAA